MRRAYNAVILHDGNVISPAICTFDDNGTITSVEPLTKELPFVEWIGGTLDLTARTHPQTL